MLSATAASATPPERFHFSESDTEVLFHCDGFDVNLDTTGIFNGTVFFNASGELMFDPAHVDRVLESRRLS